MAASSHRGLLIEAYRIIEKAQMDEADPEEISDWLAKVEEESPEIVQLAADYDADAEEFAEELDDEEIGT